MKQKPTTTSLPPRQKGESERDYEKRIVAFLHGDDIRTKGDLKDWKSADFTFAPERDWPSGSKP